MLGETFNKYGKVLDVYVARKRDKQGNIFAFVRFPKNRDAYSLESRLKDVKMGNCKLSINLAKFDKGGRKTQTLKPLPAPARGKETWLPPKRYMPYSTYLGGHGNSYRNVLVGESSGCKKATVVMNDKTVILAAKSWSGLSLIGKVKDLNLLCNIGVCMKASDIVPCIRYLGGLHVLLCFTGKSLALEFLNNRKDVWGSWFSMLDLWDDNLVCKGRIAWLKIIGVPVQLWDQDSFNQIAKRYGDVVQPSSADCTDLNLSYDTVAILVMDGGRIYEEVNVIWKNQSFRVLVIEEDNNWVPDFLLDVALQPCGDACMANPSNMVSTVGCTGGGKIDVNKDGKNSNTNTGPHVSTLKDNPLTHASPHGESPPTQRPGPDNVVPHATVSPVELSTPKNGRITGSQPITIGPKSSKRPRSVGMEDGFGPNSGGRTLNFDEPLDLNSPPFDTPAPFSPGASGGSKTNRTSKRRRRKFATSLPPPPPLPYDLVARHVEKMCGDAVLLSPTHQNSPLNLPPTHDSPVGTVTAVSSADETMAENQEIEDTIAIGNHVGFNMEGFKEQVSEVVSGAKKGSQ